MAYRFSDYLGMLPNAGIGANQTRMAQDGFNPANYVPSYQSGLDTLNAVGVVGYGTAMAGLPVVMNNLDYADTYMDYVGGLQDYSRATGIINNYATGLQMFDPDYGSQNFAYSVSPGTMTGAGINYGVANANPYLGLGMGINNITSNQANPFGAIPGFSHLGRFTNSVTQTLNNTPVARGIRNIATNVYDNTLGRVMDNDIGRSVYNVARTPMDFVSGTTGLIREGYQGLDRNVFGGLLPGGADSSDPESMRFDNPYADLKSTISKIGERKGEILAEKQIAKFSDWEKSLASELEGRGYTKAEAVDAVNNPSGLVKLQELKIQDDPTFGGLTKDEMARFTQLANEETKVVFKDGSDLPEAKVTPDFKIEGITQADLDKLDQEDATILEGLGLEPGLPNDPGVDPASITSNLEGTMDYTDAQLLADAERAKILQDINRFTSIRNDPFSSASSFNFSNNITNTLRNTPSFSTPTYNYSNMTADLGGGASFRNNLSYGNFSF